MENDNQAVDQLIVSQCDVLHSQISGVLQSGMNYLPDSLLADATMADIVAAMTERGRSPGDAKTLVVTLLLQFTPDKLRELVFARPV